MKASEAIDIIRKSNSKLMQCLNQLQSYPKEEVDRIMREKHNYTFDDAYREIEAAEMAIAALKANKSESGQPLNILATFPEADCAPELIRFSLSPNQDADTVVKAFEFAVKNGSFGQEDRLTVLDNAVDEVKTTFGCGVSREAIYTVEVLHLSPGNKTNSVSRKSIVIKTPYFTETVTLRISGYSNNDNLYVSLISTDDEGYDGSFADVTANLDEKLPPFQAYIKDHSENEGMLGFLTDNGFGRVIGQRKNGFVTFYLFKFDEARLKEYDEEGYRNYKSRVTHY